MRPVLQLRPQNAYNCGVYSIWMALESIYGVDNALLPLIEAKAKTFSNSAGGLFRYAEIIKVIRSLGYGAKAVSFHDRISFFNGLNANPNAAILIAYSFYGLDGRAQAPDIAAGSAHWSVADRLDANQDYLRLANPHGNFNWVNVDVAVNANLSLSGGKFFWQQFVNDEGESQLFADQTNLYTTDAADLVARGHEETDLGGYFIAISG
jgi:hypothetical protein